MTASEPKRSTDDFSLTSAAGPYMANSIWAFCETSWYLNSRVNPNTLQNISYNLFVG